MLCASAAVVGLGYWAVAYARDAGGMMFEGLVTLDTLTRGMSIKIDLPERQQAEELLAQSERALEVNPTNGYAMLYRAKALRLLKRTQEAEAAYRQVIAAYSGKLRNAANAGLMQLRADQPTRSE